MAAAALVYAGHSKFFARRATTYRHQGNGAAMPPARVNCYCYSFAAVMVLQANTITIENLKKPLPYQTKITSATFRFSPPTVKY
jgi:hypothetical protein